VKAIVLTAWILTHLVCVAEIQTLRFDDEITWKQIFDFGFRPKHLEGLERNTCICQNQAFWVEFKGRKEKFKVEQGRLSFSFLHNDFLSMVWHQGSEAITLEEGKQRADEFRKVFDGFIVQEITMPHMIDPSGLVDAGNDENNIKARVGEYRISYGFDNSMEKVKAIIPHFYITWSFPGMPDSKLKDRGDVVRPPKGYEWYSLDPKVNTPDPGSESETITESKTKVLEEETSDLPSVGYKDTHPKDSKTVDKDIRWGWIVCLISVLLVIVLALVRKLGSGVSKPR
jgi:mRNA-degrading endonuclease RelE of RelBE toxin-antitoxin system